MTSEEAGVILDALVAAFPRTTMSAETVQIYARFLVDVSVEQAVDAAARWIARGRSFPLISELREAIEREHGAGPPDADQAFAEVMRKVGSVGRYREPVWSHPAISAAVDAITWREVCDSDNAPALRAHFTRAYEAAKKRTADPAHNLLVTSIGAEVRERIAAGTARPVLGGGARAQLKGGG